MSIESKADESLFENEFNGHLSAVSSGNFEKAIQTFVLLQSNSLQNPTFQQYLIELAENIDPVKDTNPSKFFASLPCLLQSNIIDYARARLEEQDTMRVFRILFDYIQAYPRHAYKYLIDAINLLILCAQAMKGDDRQNCISILVTELFPRLCKQRLLLVRKDKVPSIKSTDNKHFITLPFPLFEQFLLLGQRFYIKKHRWEDATSFTCAMLSACGYNGFEQLDNVSYVLRFQYLKDHRNSVRIEDDTVDQDMSPSTDDLSILSTLMCEYMMITLQFVQFGYEYYKAVCRMDEENSNEKSCLIPVCSFQPGTHSKIGSKRTAETKADNKNTLNFADDYPRHQEKRQKLDDNNEVVVDRGNGLDAYCIKGVDNALKILSKAADCLRQAVDLWQWATDKIAQKDLITKLGGWEQELCRVIDGYKLPFNMHNAVLLVRSDLALSSPSVPGNLAKALELSQSICDRIEEQRRQEKTESNRAADMDIPFMFAFRVLYNIGVIYLLVGSLQQSTLEIAIILSVFPIPNGLDEKDFISDEIDCNIIANVFHGREFGLMRVTQEGLVVRCIKHLIVSLDNESEQRGGMASIDSALRWDEKAGNMIVLMQYGWPYWSNRTNLWHKIMNRISEKRVFKNREFLEYLYVSDVLQAIRHLHLMGSVTMDIIPPEFALRGSYRHLVTTTDNSAPSSPQHYSEITEDQTKIASSSSSSTALVAAATEEEDPNPDEDEEAKDDNKKVLPLYHPSFANSILPSTSMSPSWYSASSQKNSFAKWMSPSFYYSRPATSVVLPQDKDGNESLTEEPVSKSSSYIPRDIVTRCLEYRIRKYSPKITPQRMRHVLQRFLKNMVLKASEES